MVEFYFTKYGDAVWALNQFTIVGEGKDYVTWPDMINILRDCNSWVKPQTIKVDEVNIGKGWTKLGDSHVELINTCDGIDNCKLVLPPLEDLKLTDEGRLIEDEGSNNEQSN